MDITGILLTYDKYFIDANGKLNLYGQAFNFIVSVMFILLATVIVKKIVLKLLDRYFTHREHALGDEDAARRNNTIKTISQMVVKYLIYFQALIFILEACGIKTSSVLATAGIGGVAIGLGGQELVKDALNGFFILIEHQYSVGDYVKIQSYEGIVEQLGIRTTKIRAFDGQLIVIPNSKIDIISNYSKGPIKVSVTVYINYKEDLDRALNAISEVCEEVSIDEESVITEGPSVLEISQFGLQGMEIMIFAKVRTMEKWRIERRIRKDIKEKFDKLGIEIPSGRLMG